MRIFKLFGNTKNNDEVYMLCERYINLCDSSSDGYWLTDTEILLEQAIKRRLDKLLQREKIKEVQE